MSAPPASGAASAGLSTQMLNCLPDGVLLLGGEGRLLYANAAAAQLLQCSRSQLASRGLEGLRCIDAAHAPLTPAQLSAQPPDGAAAVDQVVGLLQGSDAPPEWLHLRARAQLFEGERCVLLTLRRAQDARGFSFRDVVDHCSDIVLITDAGQYGGDVRIVYANPAFTRQTGYSLEEVRGRNPRFLQGPETSAEAREAIRKGVAEQQPVHQVMRNYKRDGTPFWLDLQIFPLRDGDGSVRHFAAIERDVTAAQDSVRQLLHDSHHDPLTGSLNRRGFDDKSRLMLVQAATSSEPIAFLLLDIDHFKQINDTHGHEVGDQVLVDVAASLRARLRGHDLVARFGGEEFVCLLPDTTLANASAVAEALRRSIAQRAFAPLARGELTVSIGVAGGTPPLDLDVLATEADAAMYRAKQDGRDRVCTASAAAQPAPGALVLPP